MAIGVSSVGFFFTNSISHRAFGVTLSPIGENTSRLKQIREMLRPIESGFDRAANAIRPEFSNIYVYRSISLPRGHN